jgi:hypothetical protein
MKIFWNAGEIWYVDGHIDPEPEFWNILKCNSAESAGTGFQFNYDIFNDKTLAVIIGFRPLFMSVKIYIKHFFILFNQNWSLSNPVVLSDRWNDSSLRKVDFPVSIKCLRIRALRPNSESEEGNCEPV